MATHIFVYGTLKEGFPNFSMNPGRKVPGIFRTVDAMQLYIVDLAKEHWVPWLLDTPGLGERVKGELFEIDHHHLPELDLFEEVGHSQGYFRKEIKIESMDSILTIMAHAYLKTPEQLNPALPRMGPIDEYTLDQAAQYRFE